MIFLYSGAVPNNSVKPSDPTFKAAVLVSQNEPLEIIELKYPTIGPDQLLIKIKYSGICRSQLMEVHGKRGIDKWIPHTLGHEAVGIIQELGSQISEFEVGEKVILSWVADKKITTPGHVYETTDGRKINSGPISTFSEVAVVHESRVHKIQGNFSDEVLSLFGCALITGAGMAIEYFDPGKHKTVLVLGFGGIGSAAAIALEIFQDIEITVLDTSLEKVEMARALGFKNSFQTTSLNDIDTQIKLKNFDLCLESGGTTESIELGFSLISSDGTLIFASHPPLGDKICIDPFELIKGKKIIGSWGGDLDTKLAVKTVSEHLTKSKLPLKLLVGEHFPLHKVNDALNYLSESKSGRALLDCEIH
jgi:S-(hydroxymethyl)glutathione dehydrogenase/alcohol dehydrogenase